jgi:hypothetical protein
MFSYIRPLHELEMLWLKDGILIENSGISYTFNDAWNRTLSLVSANLTHTGQYTCQVKLRTGGFPTVTASATVTVLGEYIMVILLLLLLLLPPLWVHFLQRLNLPFNWHQIVMVVVHCYLLCMIYICNSFVLLNHLYLTLFKYLPKFLIWSLLVHLDIFLQATSLVLFNHLYKNLILQFSVVNYECLNYCLPKHKGHLPLFVFCLIPFRCHNPVSNHTIPLFSFLKQHYTQELLAQQKCIIAVLLWNANMKAFSWWLVVKTRGESPRHCQINRNIQDDSCYLEESL